jgi:hypothetical protein
MLIAKVENGQVLDVADHLSMFPNTSFSASGLHDSFYTENSVMPVNLFKPYDHETEHLVPCPPYIEDGQVYTMCVELKPVAESEPFLGVDSIS